MNHIMLFCKFMKYLKKIFYKKKLVVRLIIIMINSYKQNIINCIMVGYICSNKILKINLLESLGLALDINNIKFELYHRDNISWVCLRY